MELVSIQIDGVDWGFLLVPTRRHHNTSRTNSDGQYIDFHNTLLHLETDKEKLKVSQKTMKGAKVHMQASNWCRSEDGYSFLT